MFGTLNIARDVRQETPLKFVENRDLSSALSRNSQERPHISCEFCRSRKVRCSGQLSGCNRCQAVGAQCRYPPREPRRKNALGGRKTGERSRPRTGTSDDKAVDGVQSLQVELDSRLTHGHELDFSQGGTCGDNVGLEPAIGPQILDQEMESNYWCREFGDHGLNTPISPRFGKEESLKDRLDEWLDTNGIPEMKSPSASGMSHEIHQFGATMLDFAPVDDGYVNCSNILKHDALVISTPTTPALVNFRDHLVMSETPTSFTLPGVTTERSGTVRNGPNHRQTLRQLSPISSTPSSLNPATPLTGEDSPTANIADFSMAAGACGCLQLAACLVEELGAKTAAGGRVSIDFLLGYFRDALTHCTDILNCQSCVEAREINMLLAMSAKYMSTMCEHLAVCYAELKRTQGLAKNTGVVDDFKFSTYRIDNHKEQIQVLGCLVTVQVNDFAQITMRLKTRPGIRRGHLMLLNEAESKVNALRVLLRGGQNSSSVRSMDGVY